MSVKEIIAIPDETLKKISDPVEKIGINEKKLIDDLFETMYVSNPKDWPCCCPNRYS